MYLCSSKPPGYPSRVQVRVDPGYEISDLYENPYPPSRSGTAESTWGLPMKFTSTIQTMPFQKVWIVELVSEKL